MSTMKVHQKFPCGYEVSVTIKTLIGTPFFNDDGICPIHGKKCVKKEKSENQKGGKKL